MQITKQADYAIRAVLYLAQQEPGQRVPTSKIAKSQHIPPSFLAKIISQLSIAGLLNTSRGARGGVMLARDPDELTLLEVVEAIDGPIRLNSCVGKDGYCAFKETCPLAEIWEDVQNLLVERLTATRFGPLARKHKKTALIQL